MGRRRWIRVDYRNSKNEIFLLPFSFGTKTELLLLISFVGLSLVTFNNVNFVSTLPPIRYNLTKTYLLLYGNL